MPDPRPHKIPIDRRLVAAVVATIATAICSRFLISTALTASEVGQRHLVTWFVLTCGATAVAAVILIGHMLAINPATGDN